MLQLFVLLSFFLWIFSLLGVGRFLHTFLSRFFINFDLPDELIIFYYGTLGLIFVSVIGTLFNFFIPLNQSFSIVILFLGLFLFYIYRKNFITLNKKMLLTLVMLSIFCGLFSLMNLTNYDTGLYHLPTINWITRSALPFGLANLHDRFGFNSSWFVAASIIYPLRSITKSPFFIINALVYFFYGTLIFLPLLKMQNEPRLKFSSLFILATFFPWLFTLNSFFTSSPSPDTPIIILLFFTTFLVIRYFENKKEDDLLIALLFSFFAFTIKLSAFFCFFEVFLLTLFICKKTNRLKCGIILLILLIIGIPYLAKGVILSGYIAFPSTVGHFNSQWSVAPESATNTANWIKSWARIPGVDWHIVLKNRNWPAYWLQRNSTFLRSYCISIALSVLLVLFSFVLKKNKETLGFLVVVSLSFFGCLFWFFSAPELRFGYGYLFSFSSLLWSYGFYNLFTTKKITDLLLKSALLIFSFLLIFNNNLSLKQMFKTNKIKNARYEKNVTNQSDIVFSPKSGDQCFDAPLPCTPYFNKNLKIIKDKNNNFKMFYFEK